MSLSFEESIKAARAANNQPFVMTKAFMNGPMPTDEIGAMTLD